MLDRLEFMLGEAVQGIRRHGLMSFAAVSTVAVALYLLGGLGYLYFQIQGYATQLSTRYEIQAFFRDGATPAQVQETARKIRALDGVGAAVHIPKERAWEKTQRENPELTVGLENPYPDAIKVTVGDLGKTAEIVAAIQALGTIQADAVMYHDPTQRFLNDLLKLIRWLGFGLGGLLFLTAGILIYNAIRLTIDGRRREIRIMQLVGASHLTIRVPFFLEGALEGALGGLIATALLWATYRSLYAYVANNLTALHSMGPFALGQTLAILLAAGVLYGMACTTLAIRRPARMRGEGA